MSKHLLDETAEFALPGRGRHSSPDTGEFEVTQRIEPIGQPRAAQRPRPDEAPRTR